MHHPSSTSRFAPLALSFVAALTGACLGVDPPEGRLRCTSATAATDCPSSWFCRAADNRCWRTPGESVDAGMDAGPADAFAPTPDAFEFDAPGLDAPRPDAFAERDAFRAEDAGPMPDAYVPLDAYSECSSAAECDDGSLCTDDDCVDNLCTHASVDCDDGFSCTLDACAPATGCTYPPNPAAPCPMGRTCDPTGTGMDGMGPDTAGCIDADDCSSDSMCDDGNYCTIDSCVAGGCVNTPRTCTMDTNPCTLPAFCDEAMDRCDEPFDMTSLSEPTHCGTSAATCMVCTATAPSTVATCTAGVCGIACAPGFYNIDGVAANGCEYPCTFMSATDAADASAVDANCDGADGVIGSPNYIYVVPMGMGAPSQGGSPAVAVNLARAIELATSRAAMGMDVTLLLGSGTYATSDFLSIPGRTTMWGGYDSTFRTRGSSRSLVSSTADRAIVINGVSTTIDSVDFSTSDRTGTGEYTRTVWITSSSGTTLRNLTVTAGRGGPGMSGSAGPSPSGRGASGRSGTDGTTSGGGSGGDSTAGGGAGGMGGTTSAGANGLDGAPGSCAMGGIGGTVSTSACACGFLYAGTGGRAGANGCAGPTGTQGSGGGGIGTLTLTGWTPVVSGAGGMGGGGVPGAGGGGGGPYRCSPGSSAAGGGGGEGGGGGMGGGGGEAGGPGGGSFAIASVGSTITLTSVTVVTGGGGAGGNGGNGGAGQVGGDGGGAGAGANVGICSGGLVVGGAGGVGGMGGPGGSGGCGGSGAGGPSIGIFGVSTVVTSGSSVTYSVSPGGAPGDVCSFPSGGRRGGAGETADQRLL